MSVYVTSICIKRSKLVTVNLYMVPAIVIILHFHVYFIAIYMVTDKSS